MDPQNEFKSTKPTPAHPGRWQGVGAHVIKFAGDLDEVTTAIEMQNAERTFDMLFRRHLSRLRQVKQQAKQTVAARLRYLNRQAAQSVRAMFAADSERRRWPDSDAMELVKSVTISSILARAKAYADAVVPDPAWRKSTNTLC